MARKIVVALSKGGAAKTTSSAHIAHGLALQGKKVLLVDTDAQGDCLQYFFTEDPSIITKEGGLYELMRAPKPTDTGKPKTFDDVVVNARENLDLLPGTETLKSLLIDLVSREMGKEFVLMDALESIEDRYDYIIVDTTPTQTIVNINAYFYADELLIPYWLQPSTFKNMKEFVTQYERIAAMQKKIFRSVRLHLKYIVPVLEVRTNSVKSAFRELNSLVDSYRTLSRVDYNYEIFAGMRLLEAVPRRTKFEELANVGMTIFEYAPLSEGAQAYNMIVEEMLKDEKPQTKRQNG